MPEPKGVSDEPMVESAGGGESERSGDPVASPGQPPQPESDGSEATREEVSEASSTSDDSTASEPAPVTGDEKPDSSSVKKGCQGLPKTRCEITLGCAWSTDKVCVNQ